MHILEDEVVNLHQFQQTYNDTSRGNSELKKALILLESKGLEFPITYSNSKFPLLNTLGHYVYLSGNLGVFPPNQYGVDASINQPHCVPDELVKSCYKELGLTLKKGTKRYRFSTNGAIYARLLSEMGFYASHDSTESHRTTKASQGSELPPYLKRLVHNYSKLALPSQRRANRLLKDVISVLFNAKGISNGSNFQISLLSQPSKTQLTNHAEEWAKIINIIYPEFGVSVADNFVGPNIDVRSDIPTYCGRFSFDLQQLIRLSTRYAPIEIKVSPKPLFSFAWAPRNKSDSKTI